MIYAKMAAALIVAGALAWLGMIVSGWRADAAQLPVMTLERDQAIASIEAQKRRFTEVQNASQGYQNELKTLRDRAASSPARVVRLCNNLPADPKSGPVPATESRPDGGAPGTGTLPPQPGPDIGDRLYGDADTCDGLSAQIRGLQDFARRQHAGG